MSDRKDFIEYINFEEELAGGLVKAFRSLNEGPTKEMVRNEVFRVRILARALWTYQGRTVPPSIRFKEPREE